MRNRYQSKSAILAILFVLFMLPGTVALLLYQNPHWLSGNMTNHGRFVQPMFRLDSLNQTQHWQLLLVSDHPCQQDCLTSLDKLARLRLALGRLSRQVDLRLVLADAALLPDQKTQQQMTDMAISAQILTAKERDYLHGHQMDRGIYIADPRGYLIFSYPANSTQKAIFDDLQHLIKVAHT